MATRVQTQRDLAELIGDKYEVLQWIGGGGMADVYLARHRLHGGLFAVKVLLESLAKEPRIVARFLQEARTAASLSGHPNIVPIFDVGEGGGLHYIVMQYVEGEDLGRYLEREGRLTPRDALVIVSQVADALVWAASKGIVHRDLKPSNIRLDLYGRAIVLDFGIAKAADEPSALTGEGETLGTPYYMCPEQIRGERCDQRSDLYSLGAIFFELLTGSHPFEGDSYRAVYNGHLNVPAPSPCDKDSSIDRKCCGIVDKLLEKEPVKRYQTATALREDLQSAGCAGGASLLRPTVDRNLEEMQTLHAEQHAAPRIHSDSSPKARGAFWAVLGVGIAVIAVAIAIAFYVRGTRQPKADPGRSVSVQPPLTSEIRDANGVMFLVPAGDFIFGDSAPESPNPRQKLSLPAFYIDGTEVPNQSYRAFCEATGHAHPASGNFLRKPNYPVTGVTFEDAAAYAQWAGKRLPGEREWEKAARGSDGRIYPWGNETLRVPDSLQPVDAFPEGQSPCRALNMAGNVYEWTTTPFPATEREIGDMRRWLGVQTVTASWYSIKGGSYVPQQESFLRTYMRRGWPADR
ncbi:MAG: bifunctional serine/threonine-protein kinase/formylglycine-generating enzyme family protein, partial [Acidobacteriota bacterium]|nr:bifunctional serine/threonine-protein kinase/formylglycine-generating enzyme family protein [Acidobacteriota bacterium]